MTNILRDKLSAFAPDPPDGAWDRIAEAVATDPLYRTSERLLHFEAAPPPQAWEKISAALNAPVRKARVINLLSRKYRRPTLAAAAVLLVVGSLGYVFYLSGSAVTKTPHATPSYKTQSMLPPLVPDNFPQKHANVAQATARPLSRSIGRPSRFAPRMRQLLLRIIPKGVQMNGIVAKPLAPENAASRRMPIADNRHDEFMVYTDSNGRSVLLPKKLFPYMHCADEDVDCKRRLQQLQQKLSVGAAGADFTGVLEILSQLQENQ